MTLKQKFLLVLSSLVNAGLGFYAFLVMAFATSPTMDDVTMRVGFYVLNAIILAAVAGVIGPWVCMARNNSRAALWFALAPVLLLCLAGLAFLLLDSWLNRTFG
jgi:hypothetical protein